MLHNFTHYEKLIPMNTRIKHGTDRSRPIRDGPAGAHWQAVSDHYGRLSIEGVQKRLSDPVYTSLNLAIR